jgi:hypothetical protein
MKIGGFAQHRELESMCAGSLFATEALKAALGNNRTLFADEMATIRRANVPRSFSRTVTRSMIFHDRLSAIRSKSSSMSGDRGSAKRG